MNLIRGFKILVWNSALRRYHGILHTALEIILLPLLVSMCGAVFVATKPTTNKNTVIFNAEKINTTISKLYYWPDDNPTINGIMNNAKTASGAKELRGFKTELAMEHELNKQNSSGCLGVAFSDVEKLPQNLIYSIRGPARDFSATLVLLPINETGFQYYFDTGFLATQYVVDTSFIKQVSGKSLSTEVNVQRMPYPPYKWESILIILMVLYLITLLFLFGVILSVTFIIPQIAEEKASGMRNLMKIMGFPGWILFLNWYVYALMTMIPMAVLATWILTTSKFFWIALLPTTDFTIIFIFLVLSCLHALSFALLLVAIFRFVNTTLYINLLMMPYSVYFMVELIMFKHGAPKFIYLLFTIIPGQAIVAGVRTLTEFQGNGEGVKWSTIASGTNQRVTHISMLTVYIILLMSTVIMTLLAYFIQDAMQNANVFNPLLKLFKWKKEEEEIVDPIIRNRKPSIERAPKSFRKLIEMKSVVKTFGTTRALNGLTIDIYDNQVTCLLGHNGAGKSTAINVMCGLYRPTSGTIKLNGYYIQNKMSKASESLGYCPQNDVYFRNMTVYQHLIFFSMIKGIAYTHAKREALEFLENLGLDDKKNAKAQTLSGGMKRRLCLGMAFMGKPRTVILDEPTSGLDPEARRQIWNIILNLRGRTTILITTHFMDEAEVLGDRIAIMHSGHIVCYGTPMYLKKKFGTGYVFTALTTPYANTSAITYALQGNVPGCSLTNATATYVKYNIPTTETSVLKRLILDIESKKKSLHIISFGVNITSIDDVFLKVGQLEDKKSDGPPVDELIANIYITRNKYVSGPLILLNYFLALIIKRYLYHRRKYWDFLLSVIFACIFLLFPLFIQSRDSKKEYISLNFETFERHTAVFSSEDAKLTKYYKEVVPNYKETKDTIKEILQLRTDNVYNIHDIIVGATLSNGETVTMLYEGSNQESPPISLNLVTNAILKKTMDNSDYSISITNHPYEIKDRNTVDAGGITFCVQMATAILLALFVVFYNEERIWGIKNLQIMYGVPRLLYWFYHFIFDMLIFFMVLSISLIFIAFVMKNKYQVALGQFVGILTLFFIAILPLCYLSHYFQSKGYCQMSIWVIVLIVGYILPNIIQSKEKYHNIALYIPSYAAYFVWTDLESHMTELSYYKSIEGDEQCLETPPHPCCYDDVECNNMNYFIRSDKPDQYNHFIMLLIGMGIFIAIFILVDYGFVSGLLNLIPGVLCLMFFVRKEKKVLDPDVEEEKRRAKSKRASLLRVLNIHKLFLKCGKPVYAVRGLSVGVRAGEVFGLLGVNGAGKTTAFKIYLMQIGYCPQFDGFNYCLTTKQMLMVIGLIRGIPLRATKHTTDLWLTAFEIIQYAKVQVDKLSGGNKRKLSTAMALIGNPVILMLDEPTSGVDPVARRNLWNILSVVTQFGQSVILCSHSMDECEALCERLAIMVDGQIQCLGSIPYLKNKFFQGVIVYIKFDFKLVDAENFPEEVIEVKSDIENRFVCTLKDEHKSMLMYHISDTKVTLGRVFEFMEKAKQKHRIIEDYSCSDASLEYLFLSLAQEAESKKKRS